MMHFPASKRIRDVGGDCFQDIESKAATIQHLQSALKAKNQTIEILLRSQISQISQQHISELSNTLISANIFGLACALRSKSRNTNGENLGAYIEEAPTCGDVGDVKSPKTWNLIAVLPEGTTERQNVETAWVSYIFSQVWRRQRYPKSLQYEPPKRTTPFVRIYFEPLILYAALAAVTLEQNPQHHGTVSEPSRAKREMETLPAVLIVLAYRVLAKILLDRWVHTTPAPPSIRVFWIKCAVVTCGDHVGDISNCKALRKSRIQTQWFESVCWYSMCFRWLH